MNAERARAVIRERCGDELADRLEELDHRPRIEAKSPQLDAPPEGAHTDFDVVIAGGGLSLLYAPILAAMGLRVAVVERRASGTAHREWNASRGELTKLSDVGLVSPEELDRELVVARYERGSCRWHGGGQYDVRGVLDCAVDAGALMAKTRERALGAGVTLLDRTDVVSHAAGKWGVSVSIASRGGGAKTVTARVLVDARGASSPYATADLVCPTVGGVLSGLEVGSGPRQIDPQVGEILVTTEGIDRGRQHLWEAFPGRSGETAVYLFYYGPAKDRVPGALSALYARFFERLEVYKAGPAKLVRPTFGFIPGWSRLSPAPASGSGRVILVGDAAARHSPLTFCGFGATLRSLVPASRAIARAVESRVAARDSSVVDDASIHHGTGALARMLANPSLDEGRAGSLNELLDCAFSTLAEMGQESFAALLKDEMTLPSFITFLRITARKKPGIYQEVFEKLGLRTMLGWGGNLVRASL